MECCFISFITLAFLHYKGVDAVVPLSQNGFTNFVMERQWNETACILIHNNNPVHTTKYIHASTKVQTMLKFKNFTFFTVNSTFIWTSQTNNISVIKCYIKRSKPELFEFLGKRSVIKWFKSLEIKTNVHIITDVNFDMSVTKDMTFVIVAIPGNVHFTKVESVLDKVISTCEDIVVYIVPPNTNVERSIVAKLQVEYFPKILIYQKKYRYQPLKYISQLNGEYEISEQSIKLKLLLYKTQSLIISTNLMTMYMTNKHYLKRPSILCIFSSLDINSYHYLHTFHRTAMAFTKEHDMANFVVVDISKTENNLVITRRLKVFDISSVPFTLFVYVNETSGGTIQQKTLQTNVVPTMLVMERFLQRLNLLKNFKFVYYNQWTAMSCSSIQTNFSFPGDKPLIVFGPARRKKRKQRIKKSFDRVNMVTDSTWSSVFAGASTVQSTYSLLNGKSRQQSKLILVIFISKECSYCKLLQSEFKQLAKSVQYLDGVSMYLMNCSYSPIKCKEYHVTGYPTLILFRVVPSSNDDCISNQYWSTPTQIDYHGELQSDDILKWLSELTLPVLKFRSNEDSEMTKDIELMGKLYTKYYVQRYLSRSLRGMVLPLKCFLLICELLHSQVECLAASAVRSNTIDMKQDLFVGAVDFKRSDGAYSTLFKTGVSMEETLNEENSQTFFHASHKYNITSDFKCEDNHVKCTEIMMEFIVDHARLPVTHVTTSMFHSHQKGNHYMWEKPILLSLVHHDNITSNARFYQQLYDAAVLLYTSVNVAVLDVDKYTHWSNLFVPRHYYSQSFDSTDIPALHRYPRFCLIDLTDHSHAAFYPTIRKDQDRRFSAHIKGSIDVSALEIFVHNYLHDKDAVIMETEHF